MIEIELFDQLYDPDAGTLSKCIKVWVNGSQIYNNDRASDADIIKWRDALHNELLWLNKYIRKHGIRDES